jgi:hypothetical protein
MASGRLEAFERRLPKFTEGQATTFFNLHGGEVVSVSAKHGAPDYVTVAFATETEEFGPVALNPVVVAELLKLLAQLQIR